jgi:hypothetical protein
MNYYMETVGSSASAWGLPFPRTLVRRLGDFPFRGLFRRFSQVVRLFEVVCGTVTHARWVRSLLMLLKLY